MESLGANINMKTLKNQRFKLLVAHWIYTILEHFKNIRLLTWLSFKSIITPRHSIFKILRNRTFVGDGIVTSHDISILQKSSSAFHNSMEGLPTPVVLNYSRIDWRVHICTWAAAQVERVDGDFIDCGVWYGALPKTICEYINIDSTGRKYFMVDSWGSDQSVQNNSKYSEDIFDLVQKRFSNYKSVELVRGLVPDALSQVATNKVAFLALDMNGSQAELQALEYFYPLLSIGAIVYLDDYGWNFPELRTAVNTFLRNKPEELLVFPSGNAIFIKK